MRPSTGLRTELRRRSLRTNGDGSGLHPHHGPGFVEQVNRGIRQPVVAQVACRQLRGRLDGRRRVAHAVVFFVSFLQSLQDAHRLLDRGLLQRHLLEAARERAVLLDLLELVERRRAHHAQAAGRQHRLQQRRQVHRAAGRRAGADDAVQLVDEQDRVLPLAQRAEDGLEALLEVAAEARSREQRRRVEREDFGARQRRRARPAGAAAARAPRPSRSCRRPHPRRTRARSCAGGRGSPSCAAVPSAAR